MFFDVLQERLELLFVGHEMHGFEVMQNGVLFRHYFLAHRTFDLLQVVLQVDAELLVGDGCVVAVIALLGDRLIIILKFRGSKLTLNRISKLWVFVWAAKFPLLVKALLQTRQENGFSPE